MKSIFTLLSLLCASPNFVNAQQTYCTTDLHVDGNTCYTFTQGNLTAIHLGIRDFILKGHGISKIVDTGTGCGTSKNGPPFQPGYSDRTTLTPVELRRDSTYTVTVKEEDGVDSAGITRKFDWFPTWVAIDFNDNFAFDTAAANGEFVIVADTPYISQSYEHYVSSPYVFYNLPTPTQPITLSFKIKIPKSAPYGIHRLRIRALGAYGPGALPCVKTSRGETQDYLVNIVQVPASVGSLATRADRFSLAPNPATATTTLQIPAGSAATEAQLLDVQGRICATQSAPAGTTTLSFATDALPAGLYFVKVTEQGQPPVVLKLVK